MTFHMLKATVEEIQKQQRRFVRQQPVNNIKNRKQLLHQAKKMLEDNEDIWLKALEKDLGKPAVEAYASEIGLVLNEIDYLLKHLSKWLKVKTKKRFLLSGLEKVRITREPFGSVLVLAPWNYPVQLSLAPIVGALAAGNSAVLKPSESAPAVSQLFKELVPKYFSPETFYVIEGDADVADALTDLKWDFIFYTGSPEIGQKVYEKAATHLTPVVLELGGKNPCIMDESAFTEEIIRQITWGKFINTGQTCIAPDTLYVPRTIYKEVVEAIQKQLNIFYGENPKDSPDYGRIIHSKHLDKMKMFLQDGEVFYGGAFDEEDLFLAPTLLINIKEGSPVDTEEIFGPILPIIPYDEVNEVLDAYRDRSIPLVAYVFSKNKSFIAHINSQLACGSFSVNQVLVHASSPNVPFGGKGKSGLGSYHGKASFDTFTHERAFYKKIEPFSFSQQFPPYTKQTLQLLRKFRRKIY